jgi:hypothetical protein
MLKEGKIISLEGPMGSGKTLTAVALIFTEFLDTEIKRFMLPYVWEHVPFAELAPVLQEKFAIDPKRGLGYYKACLELVLQGVRQLAPVRVVSNMKLNFPSTYWDRQYFVEHLDTLEDCVLLWDEPYRDIDARFSTSKVNILFTQWAMEMRKRAIQCYVCFQYIRQLDLRIRLAIDVRGACRYIEEAPCRKCGGKGFLYKGRMPDVDMVFDMDDDDKVQCDRCLGYGKFGWAVTKFLNMRTGVSAEPIRIFGPAFYHLYWTKERIPFTARMRKLDKLDLVTVA